MADRYFEEEIRNELAGLQLEPDNEIWQNIETVLHKERKRRWLVWTFLFSAMAGAGLLLLYHEYLHQKSMPIPGNSLSNKITNNEQLHLPDKINDNKYEKTAIRPVKEIAKNVFEQNNNRKSNSVNLNKINETFSQNQQHENTGNDIELKINPDVIADQQASSITDSIKASHLNTQKKEYPVLAAIDTTIALTAIKPENNTGRLMKINKSRWQFYVVADPVISGVQKSSMGDNAAQSLAAASIPQPLNKTPLLSDKFSLGVHVETNKQVGKKYSIGLTIGYEQIATGIRVGKRVDSAVSSLLLSAVSSPASEANYYYHNNNESVYTNRYHFFQAGINLYRQFNFSGSFSIRWQLGTAAGWLFSNNAIQYDVSQNILYHDNSLLNKIQLSISTGLEAAIGKRNKFYVGPQFLYYLTAFSTMPGNSNQHLFSAGLRASVLLSKKKK
jgi:hypothetical protein